MKQGTSEFAAGYVSMVTNIFVSYLVGLFLFMRYSTIQAEGNGETEKPFHEWIWFDACKMARYLVGTFFTIWMGVGFIQLFYMRGFGYFLGLFFYLPSVFYWFIVLGKAIKSYRDRPPLIL